MNTQVIILAAGKGTRMKSDLPKVLTKLGRISFLERVVKSSASICKKPIAVIGYKGKMVKEKLGDKCKYAWQKQQLGTGHAVACGIKKINKKTCDLVVILPGDHPYINPQTLKNLVKKHKAENAILSLVAVKVPNYKNFFSVFYNCGRVLRDKKGNVKSIVELKDASKKQIAVKEINTSYYCFDAKWLYKNIEKINNNNKQKEYYLTDLVKMAFKQNKKIIAITAKNPIEGMGVNTKEQLEEMKKGRKRWLKK